MAQQPPFNIPQLAPGCRLFYFVCPIFLRCQRLGNARLTSKAASLFNRNPGGSVAPSLLSANWLASCEVFRLWFDAPFSDPDCHKMRLEHLFHEVLGIESGQVAQKLAVAHQHECAV